MTNIYIVEPLRTPIGSFLGGLKDVPAPELGAVVVKEILKKTNFSPSLIDEVVVGNVVSAGLRQAPARQVLLKSGIPETVQAMAVNKVCSSGLRAVQLGYAQIKAGLSQCVVAGGVENMSQAPFLLRTGRSGKKLGNAELEDSLLTDGLLDAFDGSHMGSCAEVCAKTYEISREVQDDFAIKSYQKAQASLTEGHFKTQIVPVEVGKGVVISDDEEPLKVNFDKLKSLKPVFQKDGTVTAANASTLNDGASFMLVVSEDFLKKHSLTPVARIVGIHSGGKAPVEFTTAPVLAIQNLLNSASFSVDTVDIFEINEAFSVVALACQNLLKIPEEKLNITGGAVALGHPLGASGARILTTLVHNLVRLNKRYGVAGICNGGGEATSILVERV